MPNTSYILDAAREMWIKYADPSKLNSDPFKGLQEKEAELAKMTHESFQKSMPDYEAREAEVAAKMGNKLKGLITGANTIDDMFIRPPSISISELTHPGLTTIKINEPYIITISLSGGNQNISNYVCQLTIAPVLHTGTSERVFLNDVTVNSVRQISFDIVFLAVGNYSILFEGVQPEYPTLKIFQRKSAYAIS